MKAVIITNSANHRNTEGRDAPGTERLVNAQPQMRDGLYEHFVGTQRGHCRTKALQHEEVGDSPSFFPGNINLQVHNGGLQRQINSMTAPALPSVVGVVMSGLSLPSHADACPNPFPHPLQQSPCHKAPVSTLHSTPTKPLDTGRSWILKWGVQMVGCIIA